MTNLMHGKSIHCGFISAAAALLFLACPQGRGDVLASQTLVVVPSRPHVLGLFFDVIQMRDAALVSYRSDAAAAEPVIHVWKRTEWSRVGFNDFCALRFTRQAPATVIVVGDDQSVPQALLQGMHWPCKIIRLRNLEEAELLRGFDQCFHFDPHEWKLLADRYDLTPKNKAVARPAAPAETNAVAPQASVPPAAVPPKKNVAPASQGRSPDNAGRKTAGGFRLSLGEKEDILFVRIEPLGILVGQYEITNAQYERFNRAHDPKKYYDHIIDKPDQPAVFVSWEDANNYCGWLNRNFAVQLPAGFECRLPTEKEWMAFAACGRARAYPWGDQWPPPAEFNYKGTEGSSVLYNMVHNERFMRNHQDGFIVTAPVSESGTNEWGLYGVGGNAWEWCQDWFDNTKTTRVLKGAAWNNHEPWILAISNRSDGLPEKSNAMIGFRVVIAPRPSPAGPRGPIKN